ncbi:YicC family protein [Gammaproteobacteria bacterium 45_16_T64]|nr:YicC family protein [Gammaproteobacteria bacterium 45_16_T64]
MIRSMTAFSRKESKTQWGDISWEVRSVNHRYLEAHPRLPEPLRDIENAVRERIRKRLSRGKVECTLKLKTDHLAPSNISINEALTQQLIQASEQLKALAPTAAPLSTQAILSWPGVISSEEADFTEIRKESLTLLDGAFDEFIEHREREGQELARLIHERLEGVLIQVELVKEYLPDILSAQREKILGKLEEAQVSLDTDRLEQEMVMIAQKTDVDEEIDRLTTHVTEVQRTLNKGGACGRRLDFLMQELNREANTLGSKSIHSNTTQVAVELKVLIEQMREQIQNIE